jgi:sialate O-acetylesterase
VISSGAALDLVATTAGGEDRRSDILMGDVWLCSGQSNMEWPVSRALNPANYLEGPFDPTIRLLKVSKANASAPRQALPEGDRWTRADAATLKDFSALCYFFALEMRKTHDGPLGLIDSSWGGSEIEAWIGPEALASAGLESERLALLQAYASDPAEGMARFAREWEGWWRKADPSGSTPWSQADSGSWKPLTGAMQDWKNYGDPELESHLGMVWFRKTVTLSADEARALNRIELGQIDEIDALWINGRMVATSFGWGTPRRYDLAQGVLREGENTIVVNVLNGWGRGGLLGPAEEMRLAGDDANVPLSDGWSYRKVAREAGSPPVAPWFSINGLSGLSNAMIAPLSSYAMKGGLWYQGESNTGRPHAYARLLRTLLSDWRGRFGAQMPVLVIQLPEYGALQSLPLQSGWASLREAQRAVAVADPLTGLVVAMDAGLRSDIHPPDKLTIAQRARAALEGLQQGDTLRADGFPPVAAVAGRNAVEVTWPGVAGGRLRLSGHHRVVGLQVCGAEGACEFVDGVLSERGIRIEGEFEPRAVGSIRYCWADVPLCNLYTDDWTPVAPFELKVEAAGSRP